MGIKDCLISAHEQGAITREEAQSLADLFDENFAQNRLAMGDAAALAKSKMKVEEALRADAIEKRRRADLTEAARLTLKTRLQASTDGALNWATGTLSHYGLGGSAGSSVRGAIEAIRVTANSSISDFMFTFRRSGILGKRENRAVISDFVKEMHGENSGDATAKALAESVAKVYEDLRQRFNAAGGAIGKLKDWGMPHSHDAAKIRAVGPEPWKDFIRARLDPAQIIDSLTGSPISSARLEQALNKSYQNIVTDGMANMVPTTQRQGLGAIASRHQDERFFVFKDAASWLEYHNQFGKGDIVQAAVHHIDTMARDIGAMEILGPNPAAMVEWMKQVVEQDVSRMKLGQPAITKSGTLSEKILGDSQAKASSAYIGWLWQTMRGSGTVHSGVVNFTDNLKNITSAAVLGTTGVLAAATDPFVAMAARRLGGLPVTKNIGNMMQMVSRQSRDDIVRSGVAWGEYMHVMGDHMRFFGPMAGNSWTKWIADRAVTWNGLTPLTTGRRLVEARAWQGHIADLAKAGTTFDHIDPVFKRAITSFGVTEKDWKIWTSSVDATGHVTPMEIISKGGSVSYLDLNKVPMTDPARFDELKALEHRHAAEKLAEFVTSWTERSNPSGTPNTIAFLQAGQKRGTIPGELLNYFSQFKAFPLSFTAMQLEAIGEVASRNGGGMKGKLSGLGYMAALAVPLTLAGGVYNQLRHMRDGKDFEDMNPMTNPVFWVQAAATGGGFGLFADFLKASENRFGQKPLAAVEGPGLAALQDGLGTIFHFMADTGKFAWDKARGNAADHFQETARRVRGDLQHWTPIASSHPAVVAAYNRLILDNLQWLTDPHADRAFKARAKKADSSGSPYFLPPGTFTPAGNRLPARRTPNWMSAVGQ